MDTLGAALYATSDDMLKEHSDLAPWRPPVGITPRLSDAGLVTLATMQAILRVAYEPPKRLPRNSLVLTRRMSHHHLAEPRDGGGRAT